ncbi:hypothetical protein KVR01_003210 [Diaporthe batatas]|uniref:uncharacterized protein n=1 Tax=Diaporthe batatas TaxID=748121 RepID=UPI001D046C1C|nr:uncharacterized protein KVR01_003210 [Diaporthe batatas]KAG8167521.1 hypothetical protein KVR01_003210 [Diaporthe batatas]
MALRVEDKLEEVHEELLTWANSIGVEIDRIRPMRISGRGFGVVATDYIPKGTDILTVPVSALRTKDTVPTAIVTSLPKDVTVHGLLAADLALNQAANDTTYSKWQAVVPTVQDIQLSMPLTWPASLQSILPAGTSHLLDKQRAKFDKDWDTVSAAFPIEARAKAKGGKVRKECTRDEYLYAWLLVNTRTFYFVTPKTEKLPKGDHMVLQPVADLFNHTDRDGCDVTFNHAESFAFRTTRDYEKGDEVHISYGSHSNDFLLVEYGFILAQNHWDEVRLDEDVIMPALSRRQREELEDVGFLGNYVLDSDTLCHRTQVALRQMAVTGRYGGLTMDEWRKFVSGLDDGEKNQAKVDAQAVSLLKKYEATIKSKEKELKKVRIRDEDGNEEMNESRKETLLRRWGQIRKLVRTTIERLEDE